MERSSIFGNQRFLKRSNQISIASRPFEYIFHDPILKTMKQYTKKSVPIRNTRDRSVKVLDLTLPMLAPLPMPKKQAISAKKSSNSHKLSTRHRKIISDLCINSSTSLNLYY